MACTATWLLGLMRKTDSLHIIGQSFTLAKRFPSKTTTPLYLSVQLDALVDWRFMFHVTAT